jgi:uncharacterized protein YbaP (TraB family)
MHTGDPRVLALTRIVEPQLSGAQRLVLEMVPSGPALLQTVRAGLLPSGQSLSELLEPALREEVFSAAASRGIDRTVADRMRPWALATAFSLPADSAAGFLDLRLYQLAEERGIEVVGLESAAEQLAIFEALEWSAEVELLRRSVKNLAQLPQQFEDMVEAYLAGDLVALEAMADEQLALLGEELGHWFEQQMLLERNERMADRLAPLLEGGGAFVAVGALHLIGDTGLYVALARLGCNMRRVH